MNYCPLCDTEYTSGYERCTICGVELVPSELRGRPLHEKERRESIDLVWTSSDPVAVSQAIAELREKGIPHHVKATRDQFVFELGMPRPRYEVRVFHSDVQRARELLEPIYQSPPFSLGAPAKVEAQEAREAQEAERFAERGAVPWNSQEATAEIWSGEDGGLAQVFEDCLRENRIGVRRQGGETGMLRLLVMPKDAEAAREILREIREGVPPS
ncbi:MAG: hypothetical protein LAN71_07835 [Acidobacteriia bacterium]|nr:hypothetical protein [Terriglobia bacterium]